MFDLKQSWPYYGWVHCNPHIKEWEIYHKIFFGQLRCFLKKRIFTILDMPAYLYLCHFKNLPVTLSVFQATGRPPHIKGKLGHNRNSKFAGQGALFSFSNLTAVPNEFPIQEYDIIAQRETTRVENFFGGGLFLENSSSLSSSSSPYFIIIIIITIFLLPFFIMTIIVRRVEMASTRTAPP